MRTTLRLACFCALALLALLPGLGCSERDEKSPVARHGVLDLTHWDPTRDGPVALDGQWAFYWDRLLTPNDFAQDDNPPARNGYLSFPGFWRGYELAGRSLPGQGMATFRLRILTGPGAHQFELLLFSIPAAFRLWANGQLVATAGVVGQSRQDETAERQMTFAKCSTEGSTLDLVLQVSNHYYRRGGVHYPVILSGPGDVELMHFQTWCWAMLFTGMLLVMSIYHYVLYALRSNDRSTLYFGTYCLVLLATYVSMDSSEWLIKMVMPKLQSTAIDAICFTSYAMLASVLYRYYRSIYKKEFHVSIQIVLDIRSLAMAYIVFFMPSGSAYNYLPLFAVSTVVINACYLGLLGLCVRRGREGALFLLCGCVILGATSLGEIYHHIFSTNAETVFPLGLSAFVLSQAFALAQRFSNSFHTVEKLSKAMESSNIALQTEMDERNRLEREIIKVSEDERRGLSHDLHDGLCQQLAVARLRCSVLAREPGLGPDALGNLEALSSLLDESSGQAYDLSRGLWPVEHDPKGSGPSLEELARRVGESSGIEVNFFQDLACPDCDNEHLVHLYRIAQEAVNNAVKHARPSRISISLRCSEQGGLTLTVRDDGVGRANAPRTEGGLGLRIMAHRARMIGAELSLSDGEHGGTVLVCTLTCQKDKQTAREQE